MCKFNPKNKGSRMDKCMKPLIKWLNNEGYNLVGCCCGHGKYPMTIIVKGKKNNKKVFVELLTETIIPRIKRFYKRDKYDYYYIPEVRK